MAILDRSRQHPSGARWKRSLKRNDGIEELEGDYQTVGEALATL